MAEPKTAKDDGNPTGASPDDPVRARGGRGRGRAAQSAGGGGEDDNHEEDEKDETETDKDNPGAVPSQDQPAEAAAPANRQQLEPQLGVTQPQIDSRPGVPGSVGVLGEEGRQLGETGQIGARFGADGTPPEFGDGQPVNPAKAAAAAASENKVPPARIAHPAGVVLTNEQLGYRGNADASVTVQGQTMLAMPAPAPATVASMAEHIRPSQLSAPSATQQLQRMAASMKAYIMDFPHELHGEMAVIAQTFRDLEARKRAMDTAVANGRSIESDDVDKASSKPSAEFFQLRHMAEQFMTANKIYETALSGAGVQVAGNDKSTIEGIVSEFKPLASGPKSPDDVPKDDTAKAA